MEQLSIEEKAKRYDEALGKARRYYDEYKTRDNILYVEDMEEIFPELKESEDEKIRKDIVTYLVQSANSATLKVNAQKFNKWITWLEKQGEQTSSQTNERAWLYLVSDVLTWKDGTGQYLDDPRIQELAKKLRSEYAQKLYNPSGLSNSSNTGKNNQEPADKVEQKFEIKEGELYICIKDLLDNYANKAFRKGDIYLSTQNGSLIPSNSNVPFKIVCPDTYFKGWTIQDAKDGDVLCYKDEISLYKHDIKNCTKQETTFGGFVYHCCYDGKEFIMDCLYSLTEQDKMDIHPATKEQRDLLFQKMKEAGYEWDAEKKELKKVEQKSSWSEEDEAMLNDIISDAEQGEDLDDVQINWLKSIKERYTWRPSDEQITWLYRAADMSDKDSRMKQVLNELLAQLKKLREEYA